MEFRGFAFTSFLWTLLSLPLFELITSQSSGSPAADNFRDFLEFRMEAYNSWAKEQFLNAPYAVKTPSISMSNFASTLFNLSLEFTDMTVTNGLISDDAYYYGITRGNILSGTGLLSFLVPTVSFTGDYNANGILNGTDVSASGTWKMDCAMFIEYNLEFDVVGGYINQTTSDIRASQISAEHNKSINMTMGGLFSGNEDQIVQEMILWEIGQNLADRLAGREAPLALTEPFERFLFPQLQQTPISDMIKPQQSLRAEAISIGFNQETSTDGPISKAFRLEMSMLLFATLSIFTTICFV